MNLLKKVDICNLYQIVFMLSFYDNKFFFKIYAFSMANKWRLVLYYWESYLEAKWKFY
jgi:hypothetical protein